MKTGDLLHIVGNSVWLRDDTASWPAAAERVLWLSHNELIIYVGPTLDQFPRVVPSEFFEVITSSGVRGWVRSNCVRRVP